MRSPFAARSLACLPLALFALAAACGDGKAKPAAPAVDAAAGIAQLGRLVGDWATDGPGERTYVSYRFVANGTALVEEMRSGSLANVPGMISVYHLDGAQLVMSHFCGQGNQPRMHAVEVAPQRLRFTLTAVTNLLAGASHMAGVEFTWHDGDRITQRWTNRILTGDIAWAIELRRMGGGGDAAAERTVPFRGEALHYTLAGDGEHVVAFVHGWAGSRSHWRQQLGDAELLRGRRLVALDLPGHGDSPLPAEALSVDLFADAVVAVLDAIGAKDAVLVGHGNGAPVVARVARRHGPRVKALVVADGPLRAPFADPARAAPILASLQGEGWRDAAARIVDGTVRALPDSHREVMRERMLASSQRTLHDGFAATVAASAWSDEPILAPLLVLAAPNPAWTDDYVAHVRKLAPGVDYQVLPAASHFLQVDAAPEFDRRLAAFLARIGR
jgi:pimeloyl-ACP methyl ester carboxylesterase